MKQSYTGEEINLIRLFLVSRPCVNAKHDRYASGLYFTWQYSIKTISIYYEITENKEQKIYHYHSLHLSVKDFNYLLGRLK